MVNIDEQQDDHTFASPFMFERTERTRNKLSECSPDELYDLNLYLLSKLEKIHGRMESTKREIEHSEETIGKVLGWYGN